MISLLAVGDGLIEDTRGQQDDADLEQKDNGGLDAAGIDFAFMMDYMPQPFPLQSTSAEDCELEAKSSQVEACEELQSSGFGIATSAVSEAGQDQQKDTRERSDSHTHTHTHTHTPTHPQPAAFYLSDQNDLVQKCSENKETQVLGICCV